MIIDHVPVRYIGKYQAALGISWGLGYIVGALVGRYQWEWHVTRVILVLSNLVSLFQVGLQ